MNNIYVDGSCSPNPGKGGSAALWIEGKIGLLHAERMTTQNTMELNSIYNALYLIRVYLKPGESVTIHSDSTYAIGMVTGSMVNRTGRTDVEGIRELYTKIRKDYHLNIVKVHAHSGDTYNEQADYYAKEARDILYNGETRFTQL